MEFSCVTCEKEEENEKSFTTQALELLKITELFMCRYGEWKIGTLLQHLRLKPQGGSSLSKQRDSLCEFFLQVQQNQIKMCQYAYMHTSNKPPGVCQYCFSL